MAYSEGWTEFQQQGKSVASISEADERGGGPGGVAATGAEQRPGEIAQEFIGAAGSSPEGSSTGGVQHRQLRVQQTNSSGWAVEVARRTPADRPLRLAAGLQSPERAADGEVARGCRRVTGGRIRARVSVVGNWRLVRVMLACGGDGGARGSGWWRWYCQSWRGWPRLRLGLGIEEEEDHRIVVKLSFSGGIGWSSSLEFEASSGFYSREGR